MSKILELLLYRGINYEFFRGGTEKKSRATVLWKIENFLHLGTFKQVILAQISSIGYLIALIIIANIWMYIANSL